MMVLALILLFLGLLGSALFTAAEAVLFSLSDSRLRTLMEEGFRGAGSLTELRQDPERLLIALRFKRLGGAAAAGVGAGLVGDLLAGVVGVLVAVVAAALLLLVLGELIPLHFAMRRNVRLALAFAPMVVALELGLTPLLDLLAPVLRRMPGRPFPQMEAEQAQEIRQLTDLGHTEGVIEPDERELIERAFRLDETRARDIMTPRVDIFAWNADTTLGGISRELQTVPYSRVPVYGEGIDDITGVLYIRDAYQALLSGQRDVRVREVAREPLIVPGSIPLTHLLRDFQSRRIHLAVVVDEYGGTDGIVSLEDVLEELVGEIVDETDVAEEPVVRLSRHEILAQGDADLREINHFFNTSFPLLEHRSLNGYLLEELGRVPATGERLSRDGIEIEILEASETQVLRARLERRAPATPEGDHAGGEPILMEGGTPAEEEAAEAGPSSEDAPSRRGSGARSESSEP